jgi:predicted 3-demethylubiquinone-9 3-methyltransferase (glyoxalase superfamily)
MQATLGVDNTPAYRGLAYIVFYDLPLADYGEALAAAQVKVEVMKSATYADEAFTKEGEESQCGWCKDKYGLSWQIVPNVLYELSTTSDVDKRQKAMSAMFKMKKIIIKELEK